MSSYRERIDVRRVSTRAKLSAGSGLGWAVIACVLGYDPFGLRIVGGVISAPLIGVLIGSWSSPLRSRSRWVQIVGSLFFLYVAAACFAVAMALFSSILYRAHNVTLSANLFEYVCAVLWGLTFCGYGLVLWPLAFFNHRLVWRAGHARIPPSPETRITSA